MRNHDFGGPIDDPEHVAIITEMDEAEMVTMSVATREHKHLFEILTTAIENGEAMLAGATMNMLRMNTQVLDNLLDSWAIHQKEVVDRGYALKDAVEFATPEEHEAIEASFAKDMGDEATEKLFALLNERFKLRTGKGQCLEADGHECSRRHQVPPGAR
jgi:hypothetical protein